VALALIDAIFAVFFLAVFARVLLSWVDPSPYPNSRAKEMLWQITEPILEPIRRLVPPVGMVDLTPLVAILLLRVLHEVARALFE
jgi:YggT family protein